MLKMGPYEINSEKKYNTNHAVAIGMAPKKYDAIIAPDRMTSKMKPIQPNLLQQPCAKPTSSTINKCDKKIEKHKSPNDKIVKKCAPCKEMKVDDEDSIFSRFKEDILIQNTVAISLIAQHLNISKLNKSYEFFQKRDDIQQQLFDCIQLTHKLLQNGIEKEQSRFLCNLQTENLTSLKEKCASLRATIFYNSKNYNNGNLDFNKVDSRLQEIKDLINSQKKINQSDFSSYSSAYF